jgi:hypothetical protein
MLENELGILTGPLFQSFRYRNFAPPKRALQVAEQAKGFAKRGAEGLSSGGKIAVRKMSSLILLILEIDWCMFT